MKILSIDGGGYLGLATASFIAETERHFNKPYHEQFQLFCGTSTGSIIALALASGKTGKEIVELYKQFGQTVFRNPFPLFRKLRYLRTPITSLYSNHRLKKVLKDSFGDITLGDLQNNGKYILVPAYNLTNGKPRVFKTNHSSELTLHNDYFIRDIALASAAAPLYLPIVTLSSPTNNVLENFCDGGLFANFPALLGYVEAISYLNIPPEEIHILSLSTPRTSLAERKSAQSWIARLLPNKGIIGWGQNLTSIMIDATSNIMHHTLCRIIESHTSKGALYERIELESTKGVGLDIATPEATETLLQIGYDKACNISTRRQIQLFF